MRRSDSSVAGKEDTKIEIFDQDSIALVERLEGLPLALVLGARHDYPKRTILTTWMISYGELKHNDANAVKLLQLWGYLDNQDLWFQLLKWPKYRNQTPKWLRQITDTEVAFLKTIRDLLDYSLVGRDGRLGSYSMHAMVHDWIREFTNKEDYDLFRLGITTFLKDRREIPGRCNAGYCLPHAYAYRLSQYLHKKHVLGSRSNKAHRIPYLFGLHNLGGLFFDQGKLSKAEAMYQWALAGEEKALGPAHMSMLETVNHLGVLYSKQCKFTEGVAMHRRALAGREKKQNRLAEAEAMYQRVLAGMEKVLGLWHISTLGVVNNLGILCQGHSRLDEAESMYRRALAGREKVLGSEHMSTLEVTNNLGNLYQKQNRLAEAEAMYQRTLAGMEGVLGPEHISTLGTVNNLDVLYRRQNRLGEAETMYQRALVGMEKVLGPDHTSALRTVNNLGKLYQDQGRLAEAKAMYHRARTPRS
ncbi:hypothetical protein GP486_003607 [Trichoglossum hirsutum]|uniref:DUF7779 domain-containing protein n=1 Tax=Trichoglossum hirsutum TaxID=265104 RepID=A0A9P8LCY1_9PEZI|nr:hypothetical protein GP486_003607 [Trichoglossum hirsutum]